MKIAELEDTIKLNNLNEVQERIKNITSLKEKFENVIYYFNIVIINFFSRKKKKFTIYIYILKIIHLIGLHEGLSRKFKAQG